MNTHDRRTLERILDEMTRHELRQLASRCHHLVQESYRGEEE